MLVKYRELSVAVTSRCNLACRHCSARDGSDPGTSMTPAAFRSVVAAAARAGVVKLYITGGEPFLLGDALVPGIAFAAKVGLHVSVITNGYWGGSPEAASRVVAGLVQAGLGELHLSVDIFHQQFVDVGFVENIVQACARNELPVVVFMSVVPGDAEHRALEARVRRWAVPLVRQSVVSLRPAPSVSDESEVRDVPCQAPLCPFVDPALNVYLCCTHRRYRQGDLLHRGVFDGTFRRTLARGVHDRLAHFLVARGPVALLRELQGGLGVDGQRIARECRTNCELCEELLSGPASVPAVLALLDAYSPTEVVDRPVEFPIEGCDA